MYRPHALQAPQFTSLHIALGADRPGGPAFVLAPEQRDGLKGALSKDEAQGGGRADGPFVVTSVRNGKPQQDAVAKPRSREEAGPRPTTPPPPPIRRPQEQAAAEPPERAARPQPRSTSLRGRLEAGTASWRLRPVDPGPGSSRDPTPRAAPPPRPPAGFPPSARRVAESPRSRSLPLERPVPVPGGAPRGPPAGAASTNLVLPPIAPPTTPKAPPSASPVPPESLSARQLRWIAKSIAGRSLLADGPPSRPETPSTPETPESWTPPFLALVSSPSASDSS
eukprot:tig00021179_g19220.t1